MQLGFLLRTRWSQSDPFLLLWQEAARSMRAARSLATEERPKNGAPKNLCSSAHGRFHILRFVSTSQAL